MARRHSNPQDFELVGMDNDPTPGDPDLIQDVITRYRDVGEAAEKAFNVLKRDGDISRGRGAAMDALTEVIGDDLPDKLRRTATSYQDAAQAYVDYIPRLQEAQETFDRAVDQATAAAPQANQTPVTLPESPTDQERAAATQRQDDIQAGQDALNAARSLAQQARQMRESAQARCAEVLERAASEAIPERSIFEKINDFFADFPFVKILLGILIAVTAIFFPVAGALLGGALFALEQVTAIATGNFSLGDFAVGLIGLVPGGALLKGASGAATKVFPKITQNAGGSIKGIKSTFDETKTVGAPLSGSAGGIAKQAGEEFAASAAGEAATQVLNGDDLNVGAILGAGALGLAGGLVGGGRGNRPPIPIKGSGGPGPGGNTRSNPGGPTGSNPTGNTRSNPGPGPIRSNPNPPRFNPIAPGPGRTRPTRFGPPNPSGNAPSTSAASNPGGAAPSTSSTTNPGGNTASSANQAALTRLNSPVNTAGTGVDLNRHELQGGHTIARHAGKPQTFLDARLAGTAGQGRPVKIAGTFNDQATAERVTGDNISANEQGINNFLAGGQGNRLKINSSMLSSDGTIRQNPGTVKKPLPTISPPASGVSTILERDSTFPGGFKIVTSFPEP
ncbi:RNase A-like domain-containing protein [Streptomyces sp. NPDC056462]|uniref:RNase A-like domain-containing protein n=1 Tax=Streptomyces sp. NPDC056462 TaxID=3345826 RepID=UPI0036974630